MSQSNFTIRTILLLLLVLLTQQKLYQVVSVFRHGARYAINSYYDGDVYKQFRGELHGGGMRQHQNLGKSLRRDYIEKQSFLSDNYVEGEIEVYSTPSNRTMQAVRSQLYGLYGLGKGQKLPEVDAQYHLPPFEGAKDADESTYALPEGYKAIPFKNDENVILYNCKNKDKLADQNINQLSDTIKEMNLTYFPFMKRMATMFNLSTDSASIPLMSGIFSTLAVDQYLGRPFPENFTKEDLQNMEHLHYWYGYAKYNNDLAKAFNTPKLKRVIADFDDRIANAQKKLKWTFLSCHDTDLMPLNQYLDIASSKCIEELYRKGKTQSLNCNYRVPYASSIIFELHSDDGKKFNVKIRKDGKYVYLCERPSTICPYEEWKEDIVKTYVDVNRVCNGPGAQE